MPLSAQGINKTADIVECKNSVVDLDKVLGISAFSMDRMLEMDPEFLVGCLSMLADVQQPMCMCLRRCAFPVLLVIAN